MKSQRVIFQIIAFEKYFPVVLLIMLLNILLTFASVNEILTGVLRSTANY